MGRYVDGYLIALPTRNLDKYRRMARKAGKIWMEHGALEYVECLADDVKPGKTTSFPQAVKLRRGERVIFSYIVFRSRAHRDRVNKKAMADPRIADWSAKTMPFDSERLIWGGFKTIVELKAAGS